MSLWPDSSGSGVREGQCAVFVDQLKICDKRGEQTRLAQLVHLVKPYLYQTQHIFQGIRRPCRVGDDKNADASKLIFVCSPDKDYEYSKVSSAVEQKKQPEGKILTIIVSPIEDKHRARWQDIDGWIENWAWVEEARDLAYAPINYATRYDKRLWSR